MRVSLFFIFFMMSFGNATTKRQSLHCSRIELDSIINEESRLVRSFGDKLILGNGVSHKVFAYDLENDSIRELGVTGFFEDLQVHPDKAISTILCNSDSGKCSYRHCTVAGCKEISHFASDRYSSVRGYSTDFIIVVGLDSIQLFDIRRGAFVSAIKLSDATIVDSYWAIDSLHDGVLVIESADGVSSIHIENKSGRVQIVATLLQPAGNVKSRIPFERASVVDSSCLYTGHKENGKFYVVGTSIRGGSCGSTELIQLGEVGRLLARTEKYIVYRKGTTQTLGICKVK